MRIPGLAKDILKYFPILVVMAATVIGLLLGESIYPALLDSQEATIPLGTLRFDDSQPPIILGEAGPCPSPNIYTSLPPKCKTLDGEFIPLPGASNLILIPERK